MRGVAATASTQPRLETFGDRILWVRVFVLRYHSRKPFAELIGVNDTTLGTWEDEGRTPRKVHEVARRYEKACRDAGHPEFTADWILFGETKIVSRRNAARSTDIAHAA